MGPPETTSRFSFFPEIATRQNPRINNVKNPRINDAKNTPNSLRAVEPVIPRVIVTNKSDSVTPARVITIKSIKKVRKLKSGERKNLSNLEVSEEKFKSGMQKC